LRAAQTSVEKMRITLVEDSDVDKVLPRTL
jgi:hypothetical protein